MIKALVDGLSSVFDAHLTCAMIDGLSSVLRAGADAESGENSYFALMKVASAAYVTTLEGHEADVRSLAALVSGGE